MFVRFGWLERLNDARHGREAVRLLPTLANGAPWIPMAPTGDTHNLFPEERRRGAALRRPWAVVGCAC